jgi:hypothetical protein
MKSDNHDKVKTVSRDQREKVIRWKPKNNYEIYYTTLCCSGNHPRKRQRVKGEKVKRWKLSKGEKSKPGKEENGEKVTRCRDDEVKRWKQ